MLFCWFNGRLDPHGRNALARVFHIVERGAVWPASLEGMLPRRQMRVRQRQKKKTAVRSWHVCKNGTSIAPLLLVLPIMAERSLGEEVEDGV